jgi:hypothetical protein
MRCSLSREEIVTMGVLSKKGETKSGIARTLGVSEGRYATTSVAGCRRWCGAAGRK